MTQEKLRILLDPGEIMRQGHFDKAKEVYEKLMLRDGKNVLYRKRLSLLSGEAPATQKAETALPGPEKD